MLFRSFSATAVTEKETVGDTDDAAKAPEAAIWAWKLQVPGKRKDTAPVGEIEQLAFSDV